MFCQYFELLARCVGVHAHLEHSVQVFIDYLHREMLQIITTPLVKTFNVVADELQIFVA